MHEITTHKDITSAPREAAKKTYLRKGLHHCNAAGLGFVEEEKKS